MLDLIKLGFRYIHGLDPEITPKEAQDIAHSLGQEARENISLRLGPMKSKGVYGASTIPWI